MSESLERRLTLMERIRLWYHSAICEACKQWGVQVVALQPVYRAYDEAAARYAAASGGARLSDEARERIKARLRQVYPGKG